VKEATSKKGSDNHASKIGHEQNQPDEKTRLADRHFAMPILV